MLVFDLVLPVHYTDSSDLRRTCYTVLLCSFIGIFVHQEYKQYGFVLHLCCLINFYVVLYIGLFGILYGALLCVVPLEFIDVVNERTLNCGQLMVWKV